VAAIRLLERCDRRIAPPELAALVNIDLYSTTADQIAVPIPGARKSSTGYGAPEVAVEASTSTMTA